MVHKCRVIQGQYRVTNQAKNPPIYQLQHPILSTIGKLLFNLVATEILLSFGFWLILASNMGPAYLPNIMDGALDMAIRLTMLGIATVIWLVTPLWLQKLSVL